MSKRPRELGWFAGVGRGGDLRVEHIFCGDGARGMVRGRKATIMARLDDGVSLSLQIRGRVRDATRREHDQVGDRVRVVGN